MNQLVAGIGNGLVKVVTGGRRCGKYFLLFTLFHDFLLTSGVAQDHIIELSLDDNFRKMIIVWDDIKQKINEQGIVTMSLLDFLLDHNSLERLA